MVTNPHSTRLRRYMGLECDGGGGMADNESIYLSNHTLATNNRFVQLNACLPILTGADMAQSEALSGPLLGF